MDFEGTSQNVQNLARSGVWCFYENWID